MLMAARLAASVALSNEMAASVGIILADRRAQAGRSKTRTARMPLVPARRNRIRGCRLLRHCPVALLSQYGVVLIRTTAMASRKTHQRQNTATLATSGHAGITGESPGGTFGSAQLIFGGAGSFSAPALSVAA